MIMKEGLVELRNWLNLRRLLFKISIYLIKIKIIWILI